MHHPALVIEDEFRGLDKIPPFIPPGTHQLTLFAGDAVGHGERQAGAYLAGFVSVIDTGRHDAGTQDGVCLDPFSVAV